MKVISNTSDWFDGFLTKFAGKIKMPRTAKKEVTANPDKITKLSYADAQKIGLLNDGNYLGHKIYSDNAGVLDLGSIWYVESDSSGNQVLVKNIDEIGNIVRSVREKKASLNKKAEERIKIYIEPIENEYGKGFQIRTPDDEGYAWEGRTFESKEEAEKWLAKTYGMDTNSDIQYEDGYYTMKKASLEAMQKVADRQNFKLIKKEFNIGALIKKTKKVNAFYNILKTSSFPKEKYSSIFEGLKQAGWEDHGSKADIEMLSMDKDIVVEGYAVNVGLEMFPSGGELNMITIEPDATFSELETVQKSVVKAIYSDLADIGLEVERKYDAMLDITAAKDLYYEDDNWLIMDKFDAGYTEGDSATVLIDKRTNEVVRQFATRAEAEDKIKDLKSGVVFDELGRRKSSLNQKAFKMRLQKSYDSLEELKDYDEIYNICERLGFSSPEEAWEANPMIQGSTDPEDFKVVSINKKAFKMHVQESYDSLEELKSYDEIYGIAERLGFDSAEELWEANPIIQGSTDPEDFKTVAINQTATWKDRLQNVYDSFEEFMSYSENYGLVERLGYETAEEAWEANPIIQGSTDPADYKKVSMKKKAEGENYDNVDKANERIKQLEQEKPGETHEVKEDPNMPGKFVVQKKQADGTLSQVMRDINKYKSQLIAKAKSKGLYENFGQHEIMALQDKWIELSSSDEANAVRTAIHDFDNWVNNFDLSDLKQASFNKQAYKVTVLLSSPEKKEVQAVIKLLAGMDTESLGIDFSEPGNIVQSAERGYSVSFEGDDIEDNAFDQLSEIVSEANAQYPKVKIDIGAEQKTQKEKDKEKKDKAKEKEESTKSGKPEKPEIVDSSKDGKEAGLNKKADDVYQYPSYVLKRIDFLAKEGYTANDIEQIIIDQLKLTNISAQDIQAYIDSENAADVSLKSRASKDGKEANIIEVGYVVTDHSGQDSRQGRVKRVGLNGTIVVQWEDMDYQQAISPDEQINLIIRKPDEFESQKPTPYSAGLKKQTADGKEADLAKEIPAEIISDETDNIEEGEQDLDKLKSKIWEESAKEVIEKSIDVDKATDDFYKKIVEKLSNKLEDEIISEDEYNKLIGDLDDLRDNKVLEEDLMSRIEDFSTDKKDDDKEKEKEEGGDKAETDGADAKGITPDTGIELPEIPKP